MLLLLTDEEKEKIKSEVNSLNFSNDTVKKAFGELSASLEIMGQYLGSSWVKRALQNIKKYDRKDDFVNIIDTEKTRDYMPVIQFAQNMAYLDTCSNVRKKIKSLKNHGRKHREIISLEAFENTLFEMQVATYYSKSGIPVNFIKEIQNKKTPDIELIPSNEIGAYVECTRKANSIELSAENIIETIDKKYLQIDEVKDMGIICISYTHKDSLSYYENNEQEISNKIMNHIKKLPFLSFVQLFFHIEKHLENDMILVGSHLKNIENAYPKKDISKQIFVSSFTSDILFPSLLDWNSTS